jgi:hypothetical protein
VVTAHHAHPAAYVWSLQTKALGQHKLTPPTQEGHPAATVTAVAISPCGNTALVRATLGDAESSLGDAESSLGDAKSSLGGA